MTFSRNLVNIPDWIVHMWPAQTSLKGPETLNPASTAAKTNINNFIYNKMAKEKLILIDQIKK